jgi:hypothetical protein
MLAWRVCAATSFIRFTAKAAPTSDTHHTVEGVLTPKKQTFSSALTTFSTQARTSLFVTRCL